MKSKHLHPHPQEGDCHVEPYSKPVEQRDVDQAYAAMLLVQGMGCPNCAMRVHNSLLQLDGVFLAEIDLQQGWVHVLFNPSLAPPSALIDAVAAAGNDGRHQYSARLLGVREPSST